jgi:hypothetical protein
VRQRHGNRVPQHAERLLDRIGEQVAVGKAGDARGLAHGDHALAVGMDRAHRLERAFVHAGAGADGRAEPFSGEAEGSRLAIGGAGRGGAVAGHDLRGVDGRHQSGDEARAQLRRSLPRFAQTLTPHALCVTRDLARLRIRHPYSIVLGARAPDGGGRSAMA